MAQNEEEAGVARSNAAGNPREMTLSSPTDAGSATSIQEFLLSDKTYFESNLSKLRKYDSKKKINGVEPQSPINQPVRDSLVSFILTACYDLSLGVDVIFHAVKFLDIILSSHTADSTSLNLHTCAILLMSAKIYSPRLSQLLKSICELAKGVNEDDVIKDELHLFEFLDFDTFLPTPIIFLRYHLSAISDKITDVSSEISSTAQFCLICTLQSSKCSFILAEDISKAAVLLSVSVFAPSVKVNDILPLENEEDIKSNVISSVLAGNIGEKIGFIGKWVQNPKALMRFAEVIAKGAKQNGQH